MKRAWTLALFLIVAVATTGAVAGESTVTLNVEGMTCASCPYIVKQSLVQVEGVRQVKVSFWERSATVTFDDERTNVAALMYVTDENGFPSTVRE